MGIYSTFSPSENLSLRGPKTLIQLAIAGLTFCSRAVEFYLAISAPSPSYIGATTDHISAAKVIARSTIVATTKYAPGIITAKYSPTMQAARTMPIQLSASTPVLTTPSHLGFVIVFLVICALLAALAGATVLHSTSNPVASGHTDTNCPGPNTNQASTASDDAPASRNFSPRLGRRSGGSGGGDEPSSSNDTPDITLKVDEDDDRLLTFGRGDPPPPDGPPPPSPATDDPEDDDKDTNIDFWIMILRNILCGALFGQVLIRGIRAFNRYRYFAALQRARKPKQEAVVAMPGMGLGTAAASSNGTSVSLYGKSFVHASLSEGVSLRQTIIANAVLLSLDSVVPKFSSVTVPVVNSPLPSFIPCLVSQHPCFSRPKGTSQPMDGALPTANLEPLSALRRQHAALKPLIHEIIFCILYVIILVAFILWCFFTGDLGSSLPKRKFNNESLTGVGDAKQTNLPSRVTPRARRTYGAPKDVMSKEEKEQIRIETLQVCDSIDKFLSGNLTTIASDTAHNASAPPPVHPESRTLEKRPLPLVLLELSQSNNGEQELENDATEQPNSDEDLTSTIYTQVTSPPMFTGLRETAVDGARPHGLNMNASEDPIVGSKAVDLQNTDQSSVPISAPSDHPTDEFIASGEETTPTPEVGVLADSQQAEDVCRESDHLQLDHELFSTSGVESATDLNASIVSISASDAPADVIPVDHGPVGDTSAHGVAVDNPPLNDALMSPPPSTNVLTGPGIPAPSVCVLVPPTGPAPPANFTPPESLQPDSSTEAGPSSTASQFLGTQGYHGNLDSGTGTATEPTDDGYEGSERDDASVPDGRGPKKARRGKRGIKKKSSSSAKVEPPKTAQALQTGSQQTELQVDGHVMVQGQHPKADASVAAPELERVPDHGKGKQKDPSEYPTFMYSTAETSSSRPPVSGTVSGTPSQDQLQDVQGDDDFSTLVAGSFTAPLHQLQDLIIEDRPTLAEQVGKGKERAELEAPSITSEPSAAESSQKTTETANEGAQVDAVERQNPVDLNTTGRTSSRKGKEKDPSEYPVAGPSAVPQVQAQKQTESSGSPSNGNETRNGKQGEVAQEDRNAQSTVSEPITNARSLPPLSPVEPSFPHDQHLDNDGTPSPARRAGKRKGKDKKPTVPQPLEAGPSTSEGLPRHGKRRRLESSVVEDVDVSQTAVENRGSSLLDSIYAPRPALPSSRPCPNPTLHPDLAAAVPNASPSGTPLSQLGEFRVVRLDPPVRTSTLQQPPASQPGTSAATPPHTLTNPEQLDSPLSPRLPARTRDLDYHVASRSQTVQPRSRTQSLHRSDSEAGSRSSSSDGSTRRRSSFSDNFRFARQITVPWEEELEDQGDVPPRQESPSPEPRPRGTSTADSIWATRE